MITFTRAEQALMDACRSRKVRVGTVYLCHDKDAIDRLVRFGLLRIEGQFLVPTEEKECTTK